MATTPSASQPADVGVSSTASTVQGEVVCVPARSKDPGWKYCTCPDTTQKNSLRCIFCHNVYKNGITRIKYHLAGIPNVGCNPCLKVPADVKEEILQYLTNKGDKRATKVSEQKRGRSQVDLSHSEGEEHGSSDEDGTNTSVVVLKSSRRARSKSSSGPMDKYCELTPEEAIAARKEKRVEKLQSKLTTEKREQKRNRACEYISQWFYEACIPFNAVTLPSFNLMLQSVGQYGEDLEGPSPYEMGGPILKKRKKRVEESFKPHRKTWELSGCTIMTDAWTDIRGRGVMNLVVHSAYGVVFLKSVDCSAVKKDGKYIFELIDGCIDEVGEKNVVQVVTDNASVNQAASTFLRAKRPNIFWNGCAAHSIDLMLEDIGKLPAVDRTITKAKGVTVFLYAHTRVLALMREFLGKDLVRSGITRFATAYLNLKSMLDNKKELQKLFRSDQMDEMGYIKKVKGSVANKTVRSENFWNGVDTAVKFFEPLANLLRRMDSDVPAMGFIYGAFLDAKREITAKFENQETCFQEVLDIVDKRWDRKLKGPLHRAGYFLNPYYYYENKLEIELDGSFKDGLVACMEKMVRDARKEDIITQEIQAYENEEGSFGRDSAKRQRRNKSFDPAKWWSNHGSSAPNLRVLAMRILSLTCSSSACERNFSVFQQVQTKRRNRLLHDKMRDLVFIKANSQLEQKRGMKERDPIEAKTFADVVEDEDNEWITGIVPVVVVQAEAEAEPEPEGAHVEESTSKRKRVSKPRKKKKLLPVYRDDELQSAGSSSESEDGAMHSPFSSSDSE